MNAALIRVAIQSSRRLVRDALAGALGADAAFAVVSRTAHCGDLLEVCELRRPHALLVDAAEPVENWLGTIAAIAARYVAINIVVAYEAMAAQEVAAAYRAGVTTLVPYSRGLGTVLVALKLRPAVTASGTHVMLTDRELQIVALVGEGRSVREVATLLAISPRTVENHKRRIYAKLGVHSQSHAVALATQFGLLDPTGSEADWKYFGSTPQLSPREQEILSSISHGDTVRQTAKALGVSIKTIENTQGRLFRKLGVRNRAGALTVAYGLGLLDSVTVEGTAGAATAASTAEPVLGRT